jgi:hypothetical protein
MAYLFENLLQNTATRLGNGFYFRGTATGGTPTTLIDTGISDHSDDELVQGTIILTRDAGGLSASPEGKVGVITAYDSTSRTITFTPTFTDAPAAGDDYMVVYSSYPLNELYKQANLALRDIGKIALWDTSITGVNGQSEYAFPVTMKSEEPVSVWLQDHTVATNPFFQVYDYYIRPAAAGSTGKLVFYSPLDAIYTVGITYKSFHPDVYNYSDIIHEMVDTNMLEIMLAMDVIRWIGLSDDNKDLYTTLDAELSELKKTSRPWKPYHTNKLLVYARNN